jgi:DNA transposition AAA+ family ATPase
MSERAAVPEFLVTKEYRRFAEFCDACRRDRYLGICHGPPGAGTHRRWVETLSARHYAHWDGLEPWLLAHHPAADTPPLSELLATRSVVYTPTVAASPGRITREVDTLRRIVNALAVYALLEDTASQHERNRSLDRSIELVLIDEADRLNALALEAVRDIHDRHGVALVLIGMPGLEKRLARSPQLYSRVGFVHAYRPLSVDELRFILERKWQQLGLTLDPNDFTDAEAMAAIARHTGGNFRLVQRLWSQIERILDLNALRVVTKEVVDTAREALVIGVS